MEIEWKKREWSGDIANEQRRLRLPIKVEWDDGTATEMNCLSIFRDSMFHNSI